MDIEVAPELPQPFDLPVNRESIIIEMFHIEENAKDLLVAHTFEPPPNSSFRCQDRGTEFLCL